MPIWHKVKFLYGLVFQAVFLPSPEELEKMVNKSFASFLFKGYVIQSSVNLFCMSY